jgi:hypothetical protein
VRRLFIVGALVGALVLVFAAGASAAVKTYGGKLKGGGKISVDIGFENKKPATVEETRFRRFPAHCQSAGNVVLRGETGWTNFFVQNGKFAGHDIPIAGGGTADFTGDFSHRTKNLDGKLKYTDIVVQGDTCSTENTRYSAKRGAPGPKAAKMAIIAHVR